MIRLGQTAETFNELGQLGGVLGLDGDTHDGGHAELHQLEVVGNLAGGDGSRLDQVLINTDKSNGVTTRTIIDGLGSSSHHEDSTLNRLDDQILLLAGDVVGTHNADLLSSADGSREHTTEGVESSLIGSGHHLGDVQHEGTVRVTGSDGASALIVHRTFVQGGHTVLLSLHRGRQVKHQHLKKSVTSRQELAHDSLQQGLSGEILLVIAQANLEGGDHLLVLGLLAVHGGMIKEVITPKLLHELVLGASELGGVHFGETAQGEAPTVETRSEGNGSVGGIHLHITEGIVLIGGDDDVHRLDGTLEGLVSILSLELQLKKSTIHLVDHQDGLDALTKGLAEHGLGLDAHTFDAIDDDESTISDTEGGSDLRGEINVPGGIDQVDQETSASGGSRAVLLVHLVVERHTSRLDGDASVLLVLAGVGETGLAGLSGTDNSGLTDQRISQGRFTMVDVSNHTHVSDVVFVVHNGPHLIGCERLRHLELITTTSRSVGTPC